MRLMLDSDNVNVLLAPAAAGVLVATYADLMTPALEAELAPNYVVIDRGYGDPMHLATVADIEPGLYSPAAGAAVVRQWLTEGRPFPTAYHDRNQWSAVLAELGGAPAHHWVATLDGTLLPNGQRPSAVQFAGEGTLGFHADISLVWDDKWHPAPAPVTPARLGQARLQAQQAAIEVSQLRATMGWI